MRTLIVIAIGVAAAFGFAYAAHALRRGSATGALVFICCWFVFCGFDLATGVRAGYALVDELGIHLAVFIAPAAAAWAATRWLG
ncbi:MAG: hypothetical protein R2729_02360 [Bryobacteraceae bacterium]